MDELAVVNARLAKPVNAEMVRKDRMILEAQKDQTLVVTFSDYRPKLQLRLHPPDADGEMRIEQLPTEWRNAFP